ncbi:MAG: restriction endonuclease fold toxin [Sciscionella sp.]
MADGALGKAFEESAGELAPAFEQATESAAGLAESTAAIAERGAAAHMAVDASAEADLRGISPGQGVPVSSAGAGIPAGTSDQAGGRVASILAGTENAGTDAGAEASVEAGAAENQVNGGLGRLLKVNKPDPAADKLADKIGGVSRVRFENDPIGREFDAVSDDYLAQSKPAGFKMGSQFRYQAKATFETGIATGRTPYFHFEGPPDPGVLRKISEYAKRYGVQPVIDIGPLGGQ